MWDAQIGLDDAFFHKEYRVPLWPLGFKTFIKRRKVYSTGFSTRPGNPEASLFKEGGGVEVGLRECLAFARWPWQETGAQSRVRKKASLSVGREFLPGVGGTGREPIMGTLETKALFRYDKRGSSLHVS